uniref:ABC transporter ATP-binding protein n=1 Tax=uncultured Thioclava sp. TaxID=473858 RepID=UPI0025EB46F4
PNLDAKLRTQMRAEIKRLHKRLGATSIYVTHDQVEAMTLADRIVVMHDGRIEQIGSPMELFLNPANTFVAGFLGSPPMNMLKAKIVAGEHAPCAEFEGGRIALQPLPALQNAVGTEVTLGIRPEFVSVTDDDAPNRIAIEVDLVETLGSEALIHTTLQGAPFVIRAETVGRTAPLDSVSGFTIAPHLIRVFDGETGQALAGQGQTQ